METMNYIPSVHSRENLAALLRKAGAAKLLLIGEYGTLSPLTLINEIKTQFKGRVFLELIAANKNRDLITSYVLSAASAGFDGVVIASGNFSASGPMARPVYDLDPSQMLSMISALKKEGLLPASFTIAARSAVGNGAIAARARYLLAHGAEYLAVSEQPGDEFKDKTMRIESL